MIGKLLKYVFIVIIFAGCSNPDASKLMDISGEKVQISPDSTLKILKSIKYKDLSKAEQAKYALLYSQAIELKEGNVPEIIEIAFKHYTDYGSQPEKMMSKILYGEYLWNNNKYEQSIRCLIDAELISVDLGDIEMQKKIFNRIKRKSEKKDIIAFQNDYIIARERIYDNSNEKLSFQYYIVLLIAILLCSSIVTFLGYVNRFHKNEYEEVIYDLNNCYMSEAAKGRDIITHLLRDNFKILNGICSSLSLEKDDEEFNRKSLYKEVKIIIKKYGTDKKCMAELEEQVNKCTDGIIQKLRNDVPDLSEIEYRQFCYHCVGFSGKLISIFFKEQVKTVYSRKFRLKKKIIQSKSPNATLFLEFLK